MATKLRKLEITKVDLCKAGADPDAHIEIFKSREHPETASDNKETQMAKQVTKIDLTTATPAEVVDYAKSLEAQVTELTKAGKMPPMEDEECEEPAKKKAPVAKTVIPEEVQKTLNAQQEAIAKTAKENADLREEIAKERTSREQAEVLTFVQKSMPKIPGELTALAKAVHEAKTKLTSASYDLIEKALVAGSAAIEKAETEIGGSGRPVAKTAYDEIVEKADDLIAKSKTPLSKAEAIAEVAKSDPTLYTKYRSEQK